MVKRHGASGFMAGAYVFPGGKVDAAEDISNIGDVPALSKTPGRVFSPFGAGLTVGCDEATTFKK